MKDNKYSLNTALVKEFPRFIPTKSHQLPIYPTSSFTYENVEDSIDVFNGSKSGHVYSRYGNPTIDTVSAKIANLEAYDTDLEAYGFLTSSGMSAISTLVTSLLKTGDHILTQDNLYGGTTELFGSICSRQGIKTHFVDFSHLDQIDDILSNNENIRLIYLETPTNPTLDCVDLKKVSEIASNRNVLTIVDNTFCTPVIQRPLSLGIDFVIHSTTKFLNGHGNSIAGAIIGHLPQWKPKIWKTLKLVGSTCNSWDAWLVNNGIKTLALRMERHSSNALALAQYLDNHQKVKKVNYNGLEDHPHHSLAKSQMNDFGGMLSFEVYGSKQDCFQVMNSLKLCTQAPTLGDVDTLILHPATSSHLNVDPDIRLRTGITDSMIRVSVGIENVEDLISDFKQALDMI